MSPYREMVANEISPDHNRRFSSLSASTSDVFERLWWKLNGL